MVTFAPPELVKVSDWLAVPLIGTLPKFRLESLVLSTPAAAAFATSGMLRVELEALLLTDRVPLATLPDGGVKVTLKVVLWPASSATGSVRPVKLKPVPDRLAWVMVRLEPPELVKVSERVLGVDACTLPKFRLEGAEVSDPAVATLAASGTMSVPLDASLANESAALAAPPDCGLKVTLKAALWPAAKVTGRFKPLTLKPELETLAWDTVTLESPELVSAADKVCPLPICTLPKLRLEGFEVRAPTAVATADTGTLTTGLGASVVTAMLPLAVPAD